MCACVLEVGEDEKLYYSGSNGHRLVPVVAASWLHNTVVFFSNLHEPQ